MGQVIETVLIQSNVLSGHVPIILWLMSSRSEDDEAFALLAGVLVFYQDKDKRKLGWLYASCHHWIHHHGIGKTKNPYENVSLAGNLISTSINHGFMDSAAVYTNKKIPQRHIRHWFFDFSLKPIGGCGVLWHLK